MKKTISWMILCIGIFCIYISIANVLNQNNFNSLARMSIEREKHEYVNEVEEEAYLIIEDELIPGGEIAKSNQERGKWLIFYIVSVTLTGIGIVLVSKNKI